MTSLDESASPSIDVVLARARAAAGGAACARVRTLRLEGTIDAGGLSGPFVQCVDLAGGRATRAFTLGPANVASGFDGLRAWRRAPNGDVTLQSADAALRAAVTQAWLDAHGWWRADDAARFESLGAKTVDGRPHDVLRALPANGDPVQLWFDRETHRLARAVQAGVLGRDAITCFEDQRDVDGVSLPWRVRTGNGDARFDRVVTIARIATNDDLPPNAFDAPAGVADDLRFVDGGTQATVAVDVIQNTIVVPVTLDGHALRFVLDSGGVTLVTAEAAARLGLHVEGRVEAGGMDGASVIAGYTRVQQLVVGDAVVLERQLLHVLPMSNASAVLGVAVDGILGAELFRRLVLRIDYERAAITLLRPPVQPGPDWGERLPLTFFAHIPCIDAVLDGAPAKFLVDTGNSGAVLLHASAAPAPTRKTSAPTVVGWGIGGAFNGRLARGERLQLGNIAVDAPALRMLANDNRALAAPGLVGNIGGAILARFTVTFDHASHALWLAPNAGFGAPFHLDRSGLRIHAGDGGFEVVAVMAGSPGDEAGLRVGDVVVAVDGAAAAGTALHVQRRAWQVSAVGTRVALRVARDGSAFDASMVLRDLIPA